MSAAADALAPVFIAGCARSGTSILGETIAVHPRVAYLFEASDLWRRHFPDRDDDRLTAGDAEAAAAAALREELAGRLAASGRDVLLEKNPKHALRVGFLARVLPRSRIVHLIRDGRDVVASLMFRNRGAEWGHLKVPGWRDLLARHPAENWRRCAEQWQAAVRCARDEGRPLGADRYLELRYEDLVAAPERTLERVFAFIGIEPTEETRRAAARIQDETAGSYHARKQVRHFVDDHARRIGRHRENLSAAQVADIEAICGGLLRELGYAV